MQKFQVKNVWKSGQLDRKMLLMMKTESFAKITSAFKYTKSQKYELSSVRWHITTSYSYIHSSHLSGIIHDNRTKSIAQTIDYPLAVFLILNGQRSH